MPIKVTARANRDDAAADRSKRRERKSHPTSLQGSRDHGADVLPLAEGIRRIEDRPGEATEGTGERQVETAGCGTGAGQTDSEGYCGGKLLSPERRRRPPGNAALRPDALEIADQQRTKVNSRRQRRTPVLGRIEPRAPALDKLVEALGLQLIQPLIKRMPRRRQLRVRDSQIFLLRPLLARAHRHASILRMIPVNHTIFFVPESRLTPQPAKLGVASRTMRCQQ